jgi:hypothetical protein
MLRHLMGRVVAITCLLALCLCASTAFAQDKKEVKITDEARKHFTAGVELLEHEDGPKYGDAYKAFRKAYDASPSPKILSNLGLCAMAIERDGEAIESYERYLEEVGDVDARERAKISADLMTLKMRSAKVVINVDPEKVTVTDTRTTDEGSEIVNTYEVDSGELRIDVHAGDHHFEVNASGYESEGFDALVGRGEKFQKNVELDKPGGAAAPAPKPSPTPTPTPSPDPDADGSDASGGGLSTASIAMLAVTGVLVVGAVVVGALALNAHADYDSFEDGGRRTEAEDVRATGEIMNITTDVLIGAAGAAAIVTGVLIILDLTGDDEGATESALQLTPLVSPEHAGMAITGQF